MDKRYVGMINYSKENNELTKKALKDSLVRLLKSYSFDHITVSKLCSVAGVSRMSFYRNYSIIHDIFKELAIELNYDVINAVGSPFRIKTDVGWYKETFKIILERKEDYLLLSQKEFQQEWMKVVNSLANHDDFSSEKFYQRLMWCGGFENVATIWITNGMKESVDEIAEYCYKYLPHLLDNEKKTN